MKASEFRQKTAAELEEILGEKRKKHDELVQALRENKLKNVKELKEVKKDIARILTIGRGGHLKE